MRSVKHFVVFFSAAQLVSCLVGCAPTRTYEWSNDKSGEVKACYDACDMQKYKCYKDCDFSFNGQIACDQIFNACLSRCPGLTIRTK